MRPALLLAAMLAALPLAGAQEPVPTASDGVSFVVGGEPGITVRLDGVDVRTADAPATALVVDPDVPVQLEMTLAPRPNVTWDLRAMHASLLLGGIGSKGPRQEQPLDASIPPGYTVFINRTLDLAALKPMGSGLFAMRVEVEAANGTILYTEDFQVRVKGNVLLTAAGATATVATVATGYGLWSILNDVREAYKARERHRKKEAQHGKLFKLADAAVALEDGLEGAADVAGEADEQAERLARRRRFAWPATGLGLGSVTASWAAFLGYVPLDLANVLVMGLGGAAAFLSLALLAAALARRAKARRSVRVPVQGPAPAPEADAPGAAEADAGAPRPPSPP